MSVRTPQLAARAIVKRKIRATSRPDGVFVLQAWSTAMSQTTNRMRATVARVFSHISSVSADGFSVPPPRGLKEVRGSQ
jgi:spermidine synthase